MAASYTWHPRVDGINPRWPIPQALMEDELFSSFLVRSALAHGCAPISLTSAIWPAQRVWTQDLDRGLVPKSLEVLSQFSGIPVPALQSSALQPIADCIFNTPFRHFGVWPWVLVLGCRNRRRAGGLQCCPVCMGQPDPFYRIQWRLAWHTRCSLHRARLIDCCPACKAALHPSLLRQGGSIAHCHLCKSPLAFNAQADVAEGAAAFQQYVDDTVWAGACYGSLQLSCGEWLGIARAMLSLLRAASRSTSHAQGAFCEAMGTRSLPEPSHLGLPFEYLSVFERERLLEVVWSIMQAGPDQFLETADTAFPPSALRPFAKDAPRLMALISPKLASRHCTNYRKVEIASPRKPQAVLRSWLRLIRKIRRDGL
ncbi:TniQ family protein [Pseudomonas yamanorum]|uniref:TniQ family protein n=1 Tax=Pseudomonas yamanorum TaxID=515393 RepID=UPI0039B9A923